MVDTVFVPVSGSPQTQYTQCVRPSFSGTSLVYAGWDRSDGDGRLTKGEFSRVCRMAAALSSDEADRNLEAMIESRLDQLA